MTTAGEEESGEILSQDARGRVLVSRERRESLLAEYDRSGMSRSKICAVPQELEAEEKDSAQIVAVQQQAAEFFKTLKL